MTRPTFVQELDAEIAAVKLRAKQARLRVGDRRAVVAKWATEELRKMDKKL